MRRAILFAVLVSTTACSAGAVGCSFRLGDTLVVVSGDESSAETALGYAIARVLRDGAQLDVAAAATSGAVENLERLRDGRADLALAPADLLAEAVNGQGIFRGATVPARTIATLGDATLHLVVSRDSPINGLSGLRGRRVATGPEASATELTAMRVLREALLESPQHFARQSLGLSESLKALRDGRIDAFFWLGVLPVPAIHDASRGAGLQLKLLSTASVVPLLQKRFGASLYSVTDATGDVYGEREPWASTAVAMVLVGRPDLADDAVVRAARGLHLGAAQSGGLANAHPVFRGFTPERAGRPTPAALHPAAARYYRETAR